MAGGWAEEPARPERRAGHPVVASPRAEDEPAGSSLTVRVLDRAGRETKAVALVLWKELAPDEPDPNGDFDFVWTDTSTGRRWAYFKNWNPGYPAPEPFGFDELPAGTYRVSATTYRDEPQSAENGPGPFGVSDPEIVDGTSAASLVIQHQAGTNMVVRTRDARTDRPIVGGLVRLRRQADGFPIFRGWGNGRFAEPTNEGGYIGYESMGPGPYEAEFLGRSATVYGDLQYDAVTTPLVIDLPVRRDQRNTSLLYELPVEGRPLSYKEIDAHWPFVVRGTATDDQGRPLPGVEIHASAGMGTLFRTGSTTSGPDGSYLLRFSQGVGTERGKLAVLAAVLGAGRPGYFPLDLAREPEFRIANRPLTDAERAEVDTAPDRLITANEPYTLDLVLVPSAQVDVSIKDEEGEPLAGWYMGVESAGEPLSNNALPGGETSERGVWSCELPPGPFRFTATAPQTQGGERESLTSDVVDLKQPGRHAVRLQVRADAEGRRQLLPIVGPGADPDGALK